MIAVASRGCDLCVCPDVSPAVAWLEIPVELAEIWVRWRENQLSQGFTLQLLRLGEKKNPKAHLLAEQSQTSSDSSSLHSLSCHGAASPKPQLLTHTHNKIPTNTSLF